MPQYDLPLAQLRDYRPEVAEPADFDRFWEGTLAEAAGHDLGPAVVGVDSGLRLVDVFDVTFAGFGGHSVRAWLTRPAGADESLPVVVEYQGYGGGRGLPHERLTWANAGYAHLFMDARGQGSSWGSGGDTPDPVGGGPHAPGFMTAGLLDPRDHYYRRLFTDGVRAVAAARQLPGVDPDRVAVCGGSQGAAVALAVAALTPVAAVMANVPFLCHVRRGVEIAQTDPFGEVARYLSVHRDHVDQAFATLSYFDAVNFARRGDAPALFSVALLDPTTPPSTVFAAFNHYGARGGGSAEIVEYPFNEHEGGQEYQTARQLRWLADRFHS